MADDGTTRSVSVAVYLPGTSAPRTVAGSVITNDPAALSLLLTLSGIPATTTLVAYPTLNNIIKVPATFPPGTVAPVVTLRLPLGRSSVGAAVDTPDLPRTGTFAAISAPVAVYELPAPINGVTVSDLGSVDLARLEAGGFRFGFTQATTSVSLLDGTIAVGGAGRQAGLQRLYLGLLGRAGDAAGLGQYDGQLSRGTTLAGVADQILAGPEYAAGHPGQTDVQFASALHAAFQTTVPDSAALAATSARLAAGEGRGTLAAEFASGAEAVSRYANQVATVFTRDAELTLVNQIYQAAFGRVADAGGLVTYKAFLAGGKSAADLADVLVASPEFVLDHGRDTTTTLVTAFYSGALKRLPDQPGLANYVGQLESRQVSRATVVLAIGTSPEANLQLPALL